MAITSIVHDISMQSLVLTFEIGFMLSMNSSVSLSYTRDKGTKIAINAFLRQTTEM